MAPASTQRRMWPATPGFPCSIDRRQPAARRSVDLDLPASLTRPESPPPACRTLNAPPERTGAAFLSKASSGSEGVRTMSASPIRIVDRERPASVGARRLTAQTFASTEAIASWTRIVVPATIARPHSWRTAWRQDSIFATRHRIPAWTTPTALRSMPARLLARSQIRARLTRRRTDGRASRTLAAYRDHRDFQLLDRRERWVIARGSGKRD